MDDPLHHLPKTFEALSEWVIIDSHTCTSNLGSWKFTNYYFITFWTIKKRISVNCVSLEIIRC